MLPFSSPAVCRQRPTRLFGCLPLLVAVCWIVASPSAMALTFTPTESEWLAWPEYCRARYVVSGAGIDSDFEQRISMSDVHMWESRLGAAWGGLHHYCAGLAIYSRAKVEHDPAQRTFLLKRVIDENKFTLHATPDSHPMWAEIASRSGLVYADLNEPALALQQFDAAIKACPTCVVGYQAKGMFYRQQKQLPEARAALEAGNKALDGDSAEIHYFLGLVLVEMGDFKGATEHADKAYAKGYPLPGLRERLARAGYPLASK